MMTTNVIRHVVAIRVALELLVDLMDAALAIQQ
jgi:hypothetical protein